MAGVPRLTDYINQQLEAGYDINAIRNHLISHGYDSREVNDAVDHIYGKKKPPAAIYAVAAVVLVAAGLLLFFVFRGEKAPEQLLDLETSSVISSAEPEDMISFSIELVNMGKKKRYDVELTHELLDPAGSVVNTKQETMALETRAAKQSQILVPASASSGSYIIKTTARYNGQVASSSFALIITAEEEPVIPELPSLECPVSCDDNDPCTLDYCNESTNFGCEHDPMIPCCGDGICETGESYSNCPADCEQEEQKIIIPESTEDTISDVVKQARELAATDPGQAADYCNSQSKESFRDSCYSAVSETANDSSYCNLIGSEIKRDSCYTTAALAGDYSVCGKMTNKYLKQSCIALSQAS